MFGSVAAFVGGHMFMGLVHDDLFVRLGDDERSVLRDAGGRALEVMPGRPMREYVTIPDWETHEADVRAWGRKALDYGLTLPPKTKK
jgi:TfoX/Sxy family transcriptional regulator of competence genes